MMVVLTLAWLGKNVRSSRARKAHEDAGTKDDGEGPSLLRFSACPRST